MPPSRADYRKSLLPRVRVLLVAGGLMWVMGCGPVGTSTAVHEAEEAIHKVVAARAHEMAPYPYHLALQYLEKAKLTEGYAEYEAAKEFAIQAGQYAQACVEEAQRERLRQNILQQRLQGKIPARELAPKKRTEKAKTKEKAKKKKKRKKKRKKKATK